MHYVLSWRVKNRDISLRKVEDKYHRQIAVENYDHILNFRNKLKCLMNFLTKPINEDELI